MWCPQELLRLQLLLDRHFVQRCDPLKLSYQLTVNKGCWASWIHQEKHFMTQDPDMQLENARIRGAIHRLAQNCAQILFIGGRRCRWCFSKSLIRTEHCKKLLHDVHMDCRRAGVVFSPSFAAFEMKALRTTEVTRDAILLLFSVLARATLVPRRSSTIDAGVGRGKNWGTLLHAIALECRWCAWYIACVGSSLVTSSWSRAIEHSASRSGGRCTKTIARISDRRSSTKRVRKKYIWVSTLRIRYQVVERLNEIDYVFLYDWSQIPAGPKKIRTAIGTQ